jgi:hypothetical protein
MKAPITVAIDNLINESVTPYLKTKGFKKKGQRFWRKDGDAIQLVEFDRGKYNERLMGKFGVSVGIFYPAVWEMLLSLRPGWATEFSIEFPPIQNCLLHIALCQPNPTSYDSYWDIDASKDNLELADTLAAVLDEQSLGWLTAHTPLARCFPRLAELSAKQDWLSAMYLFCAALIERDRDLAGTQLATILAAKNFRGIPESERKLFREIAIKHGVKLNRDN